MLESIFTVGPLLAGLAAATGLILGLTRTARLRRRESTLREAMTALDPGSKQYAILGELHRAAVAELVGRQLTSAWRVAWPWLVWLAVIYVHIEPAQLTAEYLATEKDPSWGDFSLNVLGDPFYLVAAIPVFFGLSEVFLSQYFTLVGRAEVTRNFYDGKSIERPRTYMSRSVEAHYNPPKRFRATEEKPKGTLRVRLARSLRDVVVPIALAICPGLFCASLGMMIGTLTWLAQQDPDRLETVSIQPLGAISLLSFMVLGPAVLYLVTEVEHEVRLHALPRSHPASTLDVTPSKPR